MADKQLINIGANPNDGSGDSLRVGGEKVNANFDTLFQNNVVYINEPSDFPDAVGGVRELVPTPGAHVAYVIAAATINMGSDRFSITGGSVVILGMHRTASRIESSTSDALFTVLDGSFFPEKLNIAAPNAKIIDFNTSGGTVGSLTLDNVVIWECDTIADIEGAFTTSLRTITVVDCTTRGFLWSGSDNVQINMSNCLALAWGGALFDLGLATFSIIQITGGNRFISPAATTVLTGLPMSQNFIAGGRGIVTGNLFNGTGAALAGIDTNDLQWEFSANSFADGTKDTEVVADAYLTAMRTVTIGAIGTYYTIGGTDWVSALDNRFTVGTDGIVTYNGLEPIDILVWATVTIDKVGGGSDNMCTKIAINGVVIDKTIACSNNTQPTVVQSNGLLSIESGDTIEIMVENQDATDNAEIEYANMIITQR